MIRHVKNQENYKLDEKRQSTANTEMNQILELSDKDFKPAIIKNAPTSNYKFSWNNQKMENIIKEICFFLKK